MDFSVFFVAFLAAVAVSAGVFAVVFPYIQQENSSNRVALAARKPELAAFRLRIFEDQKEARKKKQIQEALNQASATTKKAKVDTKAKLEQSGLDITMQGFILASLASAFVFGIAGLIMSHSPLMAGGSAIFGGFGFPRFILNMLYKRRQAKFTEDLADAIDIMVRGLKSGLPVTEALKIIAFETRPPVGPEFMEVVEGQKVGIPIDQGIERMYDRMPLPEVNFLAIVMAIQSKTGGNLSEALANLSKVLRERKKMKQKVKSASQEAKSSAAIIGSLPILLAVGMHFMNPNYLTPLFTTTTGNIVVAGSAFWMFCGVMVMRSMINFDI